MQQKDNKEKRTKKTKKRTRGYARGFEDDDEKSFSRGALCSVFGGFGIPLFGGGDSYAVLVLLLLMCAMRMRTTEAKVDDDFWGKKTIERDLERFSEHCDAILGAHQDRWLKLYETNERVLTIDASCSERANGIGNYLGDF